ncbi:MAG: flagellar type III secretion system pore protein FliP [Bacillota bacterium]
MSRLSQAVVLTLVIAVFVAVRPAMAAPPDALTPAPGVNINVSQPGSPAEMVKTVQIFIFLTVLSLLPAFLVMVTSFTRIVIVLSFLRTALGAQQAPPNMVLVGLALFLTFFIMAPVYNQINDQALKPFVDNRITLETAQERAAAPLREFMLKQTRDKDLELFVRMAKIENPDKKSLPLTVVAPAFVTSELRTAFQMGFLLYLPFLVIDMVVASILMSLGMFMVPPVMMSLPFKILLFVLVDGWYLVVKSLVESFA